jgi:predicted N-formylglutamate amidohydrolase
MIRKLFNSAMNRLHEIQIGEAATALNPNLRNCVFLICDHASNYIPPEFDHLGVGPADREDHVAWDMGTADITRVLSTELKAPAVLGSVSRLVIDYNRQPDSPDVIAEVSHGVEIPGNRCLDERAQEARFRRFYNPYHESIDRLLGKSGAAVVVSIHSFSNEIEPESRDFDIGLLFDEFEPLARSFAKHLRENGLRVKLNEPYSGRAGIISSAQTHGRRYLLPNFEIEINQRLVRTRLKAIAFARRMVPAVDWLGRVARQRGNSY